MIHSLNRSVSFCCQLANRYLVTASLKRTLHNITTEMGSDSPNSVCTDIVWMDLEMTGLNVTKDKILEVSCLITDRALNIISVGPCFAIKYDLDVLNNMNEWCMINHNKSGLVQKCLNSKITPDKAEELLLDYLKTNVPKGKCPLAGNSIYMDRLFIRHNWPSVDDYMHYRIIDVSTIKELARRWNPNILKRAPEKRFTHRSLEDIEDSIEELKYYRKSFFKND